MKFIIFIDALDYNDLTPWLKENLITQYNPGVPKVTPNVVSQIMTGKKQSDMRFVRSTPYKKDRETDLQGNTILNYAAKKGLRVLQYGIPLCSNIELPKGSLTTFDHFLGQQNVPPILQFARDGIDMMEDDPELVFHAYVDQTACLFSTMRSIARNKNFDVMFIGFQPIDAYTHWYNEENKKRLLLVLEEELKDLSRYGDVLFFSDHGSTKKKDVFFINKWLKDKGYLVYDVNYKLFDFHLPEGVKFPDYLALQNPHVFIDWKKTKFFCNDAFDAMIDANNATKEDKEKLRKELLETGYFDSVKLKDEIFKGGKEYDFCPEVIPDSKEGIMVSNNIHKNSDKPNSKSLDILRTGWHSNRGVVGCTDKLKTEVERPTDIYHLMKEFIDKPDKKIKEKIDKLESKSITVLREVKAKYKNPAIFCSFGKDSMVMLDLIHSAFGKIPFPVIQLDTGYEFPEINRFRDKMKEKYKFELIVSKMEDKHKPEEGITEFCDYHKIENLKKILKDKGYDAALVGIRRDEQGARNKEHYSSPRDKEGLYKTNKEDKTGDSGLKSLTDPEFAGWDIYATEFKDSKHTRIHPLLHFDEKEIWQYILIHKLDICRLYYTRNGERYRSVGCVPLSKPIKSNAKNVNEIIRELEMTKERERSGRQQDKEGLMADLRKKGYF